jgi:hypothetical protein
VQLEELGPLKKSHDLIGTRTSDLPAFGMMNQPTTLKHHKLNIAQNNKKIV